MSIALRAPEPRVGDIVLKLEVSSLKGKAPELILSAKLFALSASKLPVITALPSVIASFTVGAEIILLSIQIEMASPVPAIAEVI